ncbi:MAG: galactose-1-epimerase, partial [Planctomicrobium sp.]|nr:galactose-1-epimerase [Planctomicrobium sp.]
MPENWTPAGETEDGLQYGSVLLQNEYIRLKLTNAGASIVDVEVPDQNGDWGSVAVSAPDLEYYLSNASGLGTTPGRFANRIGRGQFELDGQSYNLAINNGPNHLHGGNDGFAKRVWQL